MWPQGHPSAIALGGLWAPNLGVMSWVLFMASTGQRNPALT
jgi:hypothetical protein